MQIFSHKEDAFGLDVSDLSLKLARVEKKGKAFELVSYSSCDVPRGIINEGEVQDEAGLAKTIQQGLARVKGKKIKTKNVVCCLPEEKSFLDVLRLPVLSEEEMAQAVRFEAENHIPVPLDEVYFDFEVLQPLAFSGGSQKKKEATKESSQLEVLIAATPKRIVDSYLRALKKAGLLPRVMEVEPLAIVRALVKKEAQANPLLLIDFGASRTSFIIFSGGTVSFTSTIPVSSQELTLVIAKALNITLKKAERIKQSEGLEGGKEVFEALVPVLTDFTQQIKTHLDYYRSHVSGPGEGGNKMERILLCGGGVNLKGLPDFLTSTFKLKVEVADPWTNIRKPSPPGFPELSEGVALGYATAFGLALRGAEL